MNSEHLDVPPRSQCFPDMRVALHDTPALQADYGMYSATTPVILESLPNVGIGRRRGEFVPTRVTGYTCIEQGCRFKTSRLYNFKRHCKTHSEDDKLQCEICKHKYRDSYELKKHLAGHASALHCDTCGQNLTSQKEVDQHMKAHSGAEKFGSDLQSDFN